VSELKDRLRADLTGAIRARDEVTTATLRMVLAAISTEEVAGSSARQLSDDEVLRVLAREAKKRREAAEAFSSADRPELADREQAEKAVLDRYLPTQLSDGEVADLVRAAIEETGTTGMPQMGAVMKAAQGRAAGRVDGKRLSTEVRRQLAG
jgi:uncharacterized protein YqeY